jgi:hypothetical protein
MLGPYKPTEKQHWIMGHVLENNLPFFAIGLLHVLMDAGPSMPLKLYTASKLVHHVVYWSGQRHKVRADTWTFTNSCFIWMCKLVSDKVF